MQRILEIATAIAHEAGAIVRRGFDEVVNVRYKGSINPVTETDTAAEALIFERLQAEFPEHLIHGEESGGSHWASDCPIWLVDPLDGTANFTRHFPHVCVSLGLMTAGQPVVGVIYDPLRDETFGAFQGGGATLNGRPIRVSDVKQLSDAFLAAGFPYTRRVTAFNNARMMDHFIRRTFGVRRAGSAALDLAYVACGRFDGFWEPELHTWDLAAGVLLVTEAGGRISDFSGNQERLFSGEEVVASNGLIHEDMLLVLREEAAAPHPDFPELR